MSAPADPIECPYVGLEPFEADHADYFFGRGQDKVVVDHVLARPLTVLYGPSGIGKSSILNVGIPAALPRDRNGREWIIVRLREWQDPGRLERLAVDTLLAELSRRPVRAAGRLRFAPLVAWAIRATGRPVLLILDQFEEYFLYRDRDRMRPLETVVGNLVARRDLRLHVLVAVRDDALHQLDQLRAFVPGILDTTIELGRLSDAGVEEAIRGPVARYNAKHRPNYPVTVEDRLVATLIRQLKEAEAGLGKGIVPAPEGRRIELPYLQIALTKLWEAESRLRPMALRESTLTDKSRLGGVGQIVRNHVNTVMDRLAPEERDLCARMFDRLVTAVGSKIAYPMEALADPEIVGPSVSRGQVLAVLNELTLKGARILKPVTTAGLPGFEIFHDVLGLPVLEWKQAFRVAKEVEQREAEQRRLEEEARLPIDRAYSIASSVAQPESNLRSVGMVGFRPWNFSGVRKQCGGGRGPARHRSRRIRVRLCRHAVEGSKDRGAAAQSIGDPARALDRAAGRPHSYVQGAHQPRRARPPVRPRVPFDRTC
jgi:hypothetical protein